MSEDEKVATSEDENEEVVICEICGNRIEFCSCVCPFCGEREECECCLFDAATGG